MKNIASLHLCMSKDCYFWPKRPYTASGGDSAFGQDISQFYASKGQTAIC
jgi:hypothetical protein